MSEEENKEKIIHYAKVKCVLCGKVGFPFDKKGLARHLRLAHNTQYNNSLFVKTTEDVPIDIKPKDKMVFKKMLNKLKNQQKKKDKARAGANHPKPKRSKNIHKSIYWGAVIKTAFETKR